MLNGNCTDNCSDNGSSDNESDNESNNEYTRENLQSKTVKELKLVAKTLNIPHKKSGKHKKKEEFITDILEVINNSSE